jgi:zona occludens toxin
MLTFITGQPGAGKTLFAVSHIDQKAAAEGRPVYFNKKLRPDDQHSPGQLEVFRDRLKAQWIPLEDGSGFEWHLAPEGAIIFLDEAHRELFPMRKIGANVPSHVDAMSTHRHRGHDVFITCQHSTQCDTFIRKMAGEHHHFIRRFGSSVSTQYIWPEIANERDQWDRKKAETKVFRYPKDYFGAYKSTVLNTVKPKLPWVRIGLLAGGAILVPLLIWAGVAAVWPDDDETVSIDQFPAQEMGPAFRALAPPAPTEEDRLVSRPALYHPDTWQPEVDDIPYSATFYDSMIQPASFPKIAGCSRMEYSDGRDECNCYSQQGTRLRVSYRTCRDVMANGWFDFSQPDQEEELPPVEGNDGPPIIQAASPPSGAGGAAASDGLQ